MNDTVLDKNTSVEQPDVGSKLCKFTDTTSYHQYSPFVYPEFLLTDGVYLLTKNCAGYKLVDFIARQQQNPIISHHRRLQRIQFWSLKVNDDQCNPTGRIRCDWDKDMTVFEETIEVIDSVNGMENLISQMRLELNHLNNALERVKN